MLENINYKLHLIIYLLILSGANETPNSTTADMATNLVDSSIMSRVMQVEVLTWRSNGFRLPCGWCGVVDHFE
jgi:hypothetical protein